MRRYALSGILLLLLTGVFSLVYAENTYTSFVSKEVGPCLTSGGNPKACDPNKPDEAEVLTNVEYLRSEWLASAQQACVQAVVDGNFLDDNTIEFTAGDQKISASITLRDLKLEDISTPNSLGTLATTQGNLSTSTTSIMQDFAPKPLSLASQPYWTENSGSNSANSRNAILFEFFDENNQPIAINAFGAWFGDLETRSDVLPAFMRFYDENGQVLSENILIPEDQDTDQSQCGSGVSSGKGCGNHTTRWIGFSRSENTEVQKMLIVVGEDDLGSDGSREHLSFIGASLGVNATCPVPTVSSTPLPSSAPTATATPLPSPVITDTPEVTIMPTDSVTPTTTAIPTQTVTPVVTISTTTTPVPTISPTATPAPTINPTITPRVSVVPIPRTHLSRVCREPLHLRFEKKLYKRIKDAKKVQNQIKTFIESRRNITPTYSLSKFRR